MPLSDTKRLKKLAKKKKKRTAVKKVNHDTASLPAFKHAIQCCAISNSLLNDDPDAQYQGIGHVIIARGNAMEANAAIFLVDAWCLGIKDCFTHNIDTNRIADKFTMPDNSLQKVSPSFAKSYIMQATYYAKRLGFSPMGKFDKCWKHFYGVKISPEQPTFTFGQDGKPLYIAGPHDDDHFQRKVIATLNKSVGPDNYHFVLPVKP